MKYDNKGYDPEQRQERKLPPAGSEVWVQVNPIGTQSYDTHDGRSSKGNEMIVLQCQVMADEPGAGTWMIDYIVNNEYATQNIGRRFDAMGIPQQQCDVDAAFFVGRIGKVKVKYEEYKGEPRARIAYWISQENAGEPPVKIPDAPADIPVTVGRKVLVDEPEGPTWPGTVKEIRSQQNECDVEDEQGEVYTVALDAVTVSKDDDLPF